MKKDGAKQQWTARALAMKDLHARHTIWAALNGYTESLIQRLRQGLASREEMAFAADLIEGKVKSRPLRRG